MESTSASWIDLKRARKNAQSRKQSNEPNETKKGDDHPEFGRWRRRSGEESGRPLSLMIRRKFVPGRPVVLDIIIVREDCTHRRLESVCRLLPGRIHSVLEIRLNFTSSERGIHVIHFSHHVRQWRPGQSNHGSRQAASMRWHCWISGKDSDRALQSTYHSFSSTLHGHHQIESAQIRHEYERGLFQDCGARGVEIPMEGEHDFGSASISVLGHQFLCLRKYFGCSCRDATIAS